MRNCRTGQDAFVDEAETEVIRSYTKFSITYERTRLTSYMQLIEEIEQGIIAEQISEFNPCRALEIGCGTGRFSEFLVRLGCEVYALDITPAMIEQARILRCGQGAITWINASGESLPFTESTFDLVIALKVFPHILDLASALADVRRVLQPRGRAILEFYNPISLGRLTRHYSFFTRWLSPNQVKDWIEQSDLEIVDYRGARIIIPFGRLMAVPVISNFLYKFEKRLSKSRFCRFASYYIVIVELK